MICWNERAEVRAEESHHIGENTEVGSWTP